MIGYVTIGTNDLDKASKFYDTLMAEINAARFMESDSFIAWATAPTAPALYVIKPYDGEAATVGNGTMVALLMESPEQVNSFHKKALELGATNEGDPGPRLGGGFYAGYFRDLDGNKLNAFCMQEATS